MEPRQCLFLSLALFVVATVFTREAYGARGAPNLLTRGQEDEQDVFDLEELDDNDDAPPVPWSNATDIVRRIALEEKARKRVGARIIGGSIVSPEFKYPWLLPLLYKAGKNQMNSWEKQVCGATLLTARWAVTAAHCVADDTKAPRYSVEAHRHDLDKKPAGEGSERVKVQRMYIHPDYDEYTVENDIALLYLAKAVTPSFSSLDSKVLIEDSAGSYSGSGEQVFAAGWGNTETSGTNYPEKPHVVQVNVKSHSSCASDYGSDAILEDEMICAAASGKDSCQGDSGGPLFATHEDSDTYVLIGITSWGYGCADADYPGVYTRIGSYKSWLESKAGTGVLPFVSDSDDDTVSPPPMPPPPADVCSWRNSKNSCKKKNTHCYWNLAEQECQVVPVCSDSSESKSTVMTTKEADKNGHWVWVPN